MYCAYALLTQRPKVCDRCRDAPGSKDMNVNYQIARMQLGREFIWRSTDVKVQESVRPTTTLELDREHPTTPVDPLKEEEEGS